MLDYQRKSIKKFIRTWKHNRKNLGLCPLRELQLLCLDEVDERYRYCSEKYCPFCHFDYKKMKIDQHLNCISFLYSYLGVLQ